MEIIAHDFVIKARVTMHLHKGPWLWLQGRPTPASPGPGRCHRSWIPPARGWGHPGELTSWLLAWDRGCPGKWKPGCEETGRQIERRRRERRKEKKNNEKKPQQKTAEERETPKFTASCLQNISRFRFHPPGPSLAPGHVGKPGCPAAPQPGHAHECCTRPAAMAVTMPASAPPALSGPPSCRTGSRPVSPSPCPDLSPPQDTGSPSMLSATVCKDTESKSTGDGA